MFAAAYARYSTTRQQETSIAAQLEGIQNYCDREGITLIGMPYIDEAKSGSNTNRPGFQRLLADAQNGKFEAVVIYDVSRGSRDVGDWFVFRKQMADLGVKVLSATNTLGDIDDPNAFLQELLSVGLGQHMVLQSRQKSIAGKRIRAERGLHCGGVAPLGYDIKDGHYVINEREAAVVRMAFERYAAGDSYADIVNKIDQTGVRGKNGHRIEKNTLHYIFKNERYTGKYVWFDREERHMHKHVGRDNADKIIHMGGIPQIVSPEIWNMVRRRMEGNQKLGSGKRCEGRQYLLSGLIRCGECDSAMTGVTTVSKGFEYPRYSCLGKRVEKKCTNKNVKADVLEKYLLQLIRERFFDDDALRDAAELIIANLTDYNREADAIRDELRALESKTQKLIDVILDNGLTPALKQRMQEYETLRKTLEKRLESTNEAPMFSVDDLVEIMRQDLDRLDVNPREIILRYVRSVTVYHDRVVVQWAINYADKKNTHRLVGVKDAGSPGPDYCLFTTTFDRQHIA